MKQWHIKIYFARLVVRACKVLEELETSTRKEVGNKMDRSTRAE